MARNIARINNYYNRIEAWNDWRKVAQMANDAGLCNLVAKHQPAQDAGWRKIDKARHKLLQDIAQQEIQ